MRTPCAHTIARSQPPQIRGRRAARPRRAHASDDELRAGVPRLPRDLRWPGGVECPRCSEHSRLLWLESRSKWHCYACRYQFSVTAGTLFHSSHLPVWKWFVAVHLMLESPRRPLGERASADDRRQLQDGLVRGPPDPRRDARPRRRAAAQPRRRRAPPGRSRDAAEDADLARANSTVLARMRRRRRRPAPPAQRQVPRRPTSTSGAGARRTEDNPHVFRDTIQALLEGEGISYERLVAARVAGRGRRRRPLPVTVDRPRAARPRAPSSSGSGCPTGRGASPR